MTATATPDANTEMITAQIGDRRADVLPVLVIDRFDHWHNQDSALLRPTSITWSDPCTIAGRVA